MAASHQNDLPAAERNAEFSVRQATSLEDLIWIMKMAEAEGWGPREKDAECYLTAGFSSNFYMGELNGQVVSSICILEYGDAYHYVGKYLVMPEYRGKGYGIRTWQFAMDALPHQNIVLALDAVVSMERAYVTKGFETEFSSIIFEASADCIVAALCEQEVPEGINIVSTCEVGRIASFVRGILVAANRALLECWMNLKTSVSVVAVDQSNSSIVGFLLLTKDTEGNFNTFPFLSDNKRIACSLLATAVKAVAQQSVVVFKVPDCNQDVLELMDSFKASRNGKEIRMYKGGKCNIYLPKVYSISTLD